MNHDHHYETHVVWSGPPQGPTISYSAYARDYTVETAGKPMLHLSADAAFFGREELYNPEYLLLASLSGCHLLTYLAVASRAGLHIAAYEDHASGTMVQSGKGGHFSEVVLRPNVTIVAGYDLAFARDLHDAAHHNFISASMNFPIRLEPETHHAELLHQVW